MGMTEKEKKGYGKFLQDGGKEGFLKRVAEAYTKKEEKSLDDYYYISKEFPGKFQEVEDETIYQDGELNRNQAEANLLEHIFDIGDWVVMERMDEDG